MTRATSFYILMLVIFGTGLWAIITVGSVFLQAPPDLSGRWELRAWHDPANGKPAHEMLIDQSGVYALVRVNGQSRSLMLEEPADNDRRNRSILRSATTELLLEQVTRDRYVLQAKGLIDGTWQAARIVQNPRNARQH